ncbi:hypothetical protein V6N12_020212 [Hibiscus sabdariffa]|uniref:Uncharacterized protein n=1 Tax=Hibiscus sabdariffa TaxID=183260 RepID=A0ABR2BMQ3_9ROSI
MGLLLTYHRAGVAKLRRLEAGGEGAPSPRASIYSRPAVSFLAAVIPFQERQGLELFLSFQGGIRCHHH